MDAIESIEIRTSHHTHHVIGTGSNDPQKLDPQASRETLDHSLMYIVAVALQDGVWHHEHSYTRERATRPDTVTLWHKIETQEDPSWTKRYKAPKPEERAFGGEMIVRLKDGTVIRGEREVADAHPNGASPFERPDYVRKFRTLAAGIVGDDEQARFLDLVERLGGLSPSEVLGLNVQAPSVDTDLDGLPKGIF